MAIVEIRGWKVGFNKVGCTSSIRAAMGIGLAEGKAITDAVLRGETPRIEVPDQFLAQQLANDLERLGAVASVAAA